MLTNNLVSTPAGIIPLTLLPEMCKALKIFNEDMNTLSLLGWEISADTKDERDKYRDMINAKEGESSLDLSGTTTPATCLKNYVETEVFKAYKERYKPDYEKACQSYLKNTDPSLRGRVIGEMVQNNTIAKQTGKNEKQLRQMGIESKLKLKGII